MKILFIGMTPNPGGLETYMINIFTRLQNKGFSFYFVNVFNKKIAYSNYIVNNSGTIYDIHFHKGLVKYFTRYHIAKRFFKAHHNFDIVHINALSVNEVYWAKAARTYGIKNIIIQSHNSNIIHKSIFISIFSKIMSKFNKRYLLNNKNITKLSVSKYSGKWMFGNNSKYHIIYNGINTNKLIYNKLDRYRVRKILNIKDNDYVIITTSRISAQKNYPKIISIFKYINEMVHNSKLVIIGNGPEYEKIYQLVYSLGLSHNVIFLGRKNKKDIPKYLHAADLMLMPSLFEGYPYSLLEAQAAGVPALVSSKVIPKESNITGFVKYISLNKSNEYWGKKAIDMLNRSLSSKKKLYMNDIVKKSSYNIYNSIKQIESIYVKLVK